MILLLVLIAFLFAYASLIFFYYRGWKRAAAFSPLSSNNEHRFISVIVPARNEEKNIAALLKALSLQTFPANSFEIILVDDYSTDRTVEVAKQCSLQNLIIIQPAAHDSHSSKKKAIEAGIKTAKGELIVTTDADCTPPQQWLQIIHDFYWQKEACFIAAPVKFSYNNSLLQIFQAIDFLVLQGITAASVSSHFHTMCNGANLAYKKKSFEEVNGFEGIDKVATGDDMLLMHKIWKTEPTGVHYLKCKAAIVTTQPMTSWRDFFMQRKRWASKTLVYDDYRIIAVLGFVYFFNLLFLILIAAAFFNPIYWWLVFSFWIMKTLTELPFVNTVAKFYYEQKLLRYFFFFQPLHIFYTVVVGFISQFGKYEWKGRRTR